MIITVNVNVNAPELVLAMTALANALDKRTSGIAGAAQALESMKEANNPVPEFLNQAQVSPQAYNAPVQTQLQPQQNYGAPVQQLVPTSTPVQNQPQQQASSTVIPTTQQTYTMDQLAVAATQLIDIGKRQDVLNLLGSFGVQALTVLPKEQYGAFATQLRALGAKI